LAPSNSGMHTPGNNLIDAVEPLECGLLMSSHLCHWLYGWLAGASIRSKDPPTRSHARPPANASHWQINENPTPCTESLL
jgi:hypothetical protein